MYFSKRSYYRKEWYFVTIIVLTYCEKNLFWCDFEFFQRTEAKKSELRKSLQIRGRRSKICNVFEVRTIMVAEYFLTFPVFLCGKMGKIRVPNGRNILPNRTSFS